MNEPVTFRVPTDHPALEGHFPGRPVVPGVLVLEAVIDAARALHGSAGTVRGLPVVKFLAPLLPEIAARISLSGTPPRLSFEVRNDAGLLAQGVLDWGPRA